MARKTIHILETRQRLGISQQELADRLGMSRPTLIKVEKGERLLTSAELQRAQEIFESFDSDNTNQQERITIPQKHIDKFRQVLLYILQKVGAKPNVGMTVLYKLLYFVDFDYYEKYETQLMGLTYFKNHHGPAPREFKRVVDDMIHQGTLIEVKSKYFTHEQKKFLPNSSPDLSLLSGREIEMIDSVLARYADKSAKELSDMSHRDMPWRATEDGKDIEYELAFYRPDEFSVREYDPL
jgi:transcriptional regulator with XRE-family HTH domain